MTGPIKKYSAGSIHVAIWENESKEGRVYQTVSLERSYKNKDDEWKNTNSLRVNDIPKAVAALQKVYDELVVKEVRREVHVEAL